METRPFTNRRESWFATNTSGKVITISDLPLLPEFSIGQVIDLLRFETLERICNSNILVKLIKMQWMTLVKTIFDEDGNTLTSTTYTYNSPNIVDAVTMSQVTNAGTTGGESSSTRAFGFFIS